MCTEQDLIEELNLLLRDERMKREKEQSKGEEGEGVKRHFICGCIVFVDPVTKASKRFGFVDFSSPEAAKIAIAKWNDKSMAKFPNRLEVTMFVPDHIKMTKEERQRSKTREKTVFTNLFVEKLPYTFSRQDIYELFSKFGTVLDVKMKKPESNVQLKNINHLPCSAYVNFKDQTQARAAKEAMNGQSLIPGQTLRIDFYQRANKFLGGMIGLDRKELINNTHFRVLFIRGIKKSVSLLLYFADPFSFRSLVRSSRRPLTSSESSRPLPSRPKSSVSRWSPEVSQLFSIKPERQPPKL